MPRKLRPLLLALVLLLGAPPGQAAEPARPVPYRQVQAIFATHCVSCHDAKNAEGKLVVETYAGLMKGGEGGAAVVPGRASESALVKQVEHREKPFMPPPKKAQRLAEADVAVIRAWIDAGAKGPAAGEDVAVVRAMPKVAPAVAPKRAVHAMAYDERAKLLAVAVLNEVELRSAESQAVLAKVGPHKGNVNAVAFSADGARLIAAAGEPGVGGEVTVWNVADGKQVARFEGHKDAIYALAVSADGKTIATGSYDQKVILWDASGKPLRTLEGHNGAVFDVAFRPDGKVLASASADRTVKLWDVASGKRLDTRGEPTKEQQTLAFGPDGKRLYAGGVDNRVRVWRVSATAVEGTNALETAKFAHEGSILRLALSGDGKTLLTAADDKTVKLWDAEKIEPKLALEAQADWPAAVAFANDGKTVVVGRLDGSVGFYGAADGKRVTPPKPEVANVWPRGIRRGTTVRVKLAGKDVAAASAVTVAGTDKVTAKWLGVERGAAPFGWAELTAAADAPLGALDLTVSGAGGSSTPTKVIVDDLPQVEEAEGPSPEGPGLAVGVLPVTFGGQFEAKGDVDAFAFEGKAGQTVVIDCAAKRFASKADPVVTLLDPAGRPLATSADDAGDADPLLAYTLPAAGRYSIRVNDLQGASTPAHYYRMSVGEFAYVTGAMPLAVPAGRESEVQLVGYNLPAGAAVKVTAPATGEVALPLDTKVYRARRPIVVSVGAGDELIEVEPNDTPARAMKLALGAGVSGRLESKQGGDVDLYRFAAKAGQAIAIETQAAQRFSAADTRVEVLWPDGRPVERVQLRAVRDSWINFRAIDASAKGARLENWEEMELNQFVYLQGEVVKTFLYPRGPDSEYDFYNVAGRRRTYFDTSPTAHALEEKCYVVEPHRPGETFAANGLPVFKLNYVNDDDAMRQAGTDSRLMFSAPADGDYLVRVTDTRGFGGPRFTYRLVVRPAKPDFTVTIEGLNPVVPRGSGRNFVVRVNRIDGFDGDVKVDLAGPRGPFQISSPVVVRAGHLEAQGTVFLPADMAATAPSTRPVEAGPIKVTASAVVDGKEVTRPLADLSKLSAGGSPLLTVTLSPTDPKAAAITVVPGERVPAMLRVKRGTFKGPVSFEVENLPHGVIVADIGLSGVLIPDGQEERQIFLKCAAWVTGQSRPCHARALQGDNPTSPPVELRVVGDGVAAR